MPRIPPETIAITEFKATCLAVLERVRSTGRRLVVTRHGEPIAEVVPPSAPAAWGDWIGAMRSTAKIEGDLVEPVGGIGDWEAASDR